MGDRDAVACWLAACSLLLVRCCLLAAACCSAGFYIFTSSASPPRRWPSRHCSATCRTHTASTLFFLLSVSVRGNGSGRDRPAVSVCACSGTDRLPKSDHRPAPIQLVCTALPGPSRPAVSPQTTQPKPHPNLTPSLGHHSLLDVRVWFAQPQCLAVVHRVIIRSRMPNMGASPLSGPLARVPHHLRGLPMSLGRRYHSHALNDSEFDVLADAYRLVTWFVVHALLDEN